ncbi:alpha-amylase [Kineococcus xinjiangensis]|uniref:Alpha-amylase n=1 Tax=Kineococcus xinjiangensis TaxID=512762 RepID=A0A2S6IPT6_9ACTN|nr:alpha-amylase family protein [Kineococcus xinjiangensis]PPK96150.1 alpha-amylase [Kineococcus xinjiangensis]
MTARATTRARRTTRWATAALGAALALGTGLSTAAAPAAEAAVTTNRSVLVHLFEWKWTDVALECERFLGPKGFAAVQISPPQEHAIVNNDKHQYPWWQRYQPVSYKIESRGGTRAQFADMVRRCNAVGVDVYADAVINHMSGVGSGTGSAGTGFSPYTYNGTYQWQDFHHCGRNGNDDITRDDYDDRYIVQNCELENLADLNTQDNGYVRGRIAQYLNDLISLGVDGFRIDAAKHMDTNDIANIRSRLSNPNVYIYQEVIEGPNEAIKESEYFQNGDVTEFQYSTEIGRVFKTGQLSWLSGFGESWGFMRSDLAEVFVDNHDNQRGHGGGGNVVTHKDGQLYNLANYFMLAWPYGYPQVMSSYHFGSDWQGPPSNGGNTTRSVWVNGSPSGCNSTEWVCEHRRTGISNMVSFHNATVGTGVSNWWSNGYQAIAFSRGTKGYAVVNKENFAVNRTWQTSLPAGTYCDVITGDINSTRTGCLGRSVVVNSSGQFTASVNAMQGLALHAGARLN